jgi:hypothetical protein
MAAIEAKGEAPYRSSSCQPAALQSALLTPPEQSEFDDLDVAEHGRGGAVSITSLERCDHIGVLLAIM